MTDQHHDWLMEQPAATVLLAAYAVRESQLPRKPARAESAAAAPAPVASEGDGAASPDDAAGDSENAEAWVPRLGSVEGIDPALLSPLHGGLIARGLLKFEVFIKQGGMRYRLTPDGRRAAEVKVPVATVMESTTEEVVVAA